MRSALNFVGHVSHRVCKVCVTAYEYTALYLALFLLGLICLAWTIFALPFLFILPTLQGKVLGRWLISRAFNFYLFFLERMGFARFDLSELDALRTAPSMIIAPNHPCLLDAVMIISRLPTVVCVLKANLLNNVFLGAGARLARYIPNDPVRRMVLDAVDDLQHHSHLLLFPEGTRTVMQPHNPIIGSVGLVAVRARVPVQTVIIETNSKFLGKGWPLWKKPSLPLHYSVRLGKRFDAPENAHDFTQELSDYFSQQLKAQSLKNQ